MDLTDIYRIFHLTVIEYTFSSSTFGTFSGIDQILGHKTSFVNLRRQIIASIFSHHKSMKLEVNYREKNWKIHKHLEVKQHAPE